MPQEKPSLNLDPQLANFLGGTRDFAQTYTKSALDRADRTRVDSAMRKIDVYADREIEILREVARGPGLFAGRSISCKMGCAYCCHQTVNATIPEVLALADWLRQNKSKEELDELRNRAKAYRKSHEGFTPDQFTRSRTACPVLENSLCSAYEARPLVCRSYHSYDLDACKESFAISQDILRIGVQMHSGPPLIVDALRKGIAQAVGGKELPGELVILGIALSIALEEEDAAERWMAGEDLFADAAFVAPE